MPFRGVNLNEVSITNWVKHKYTNQNKCRKEGQNKIWWDKDFQIRKKPNTEKINVNPLKTES